MIYTGCSPLLFSTKMKIEQEATWRLYKTENFMEQNAGLDFLLLVLKMGRVQMKKHPSCINAINHDP